MEAQSMIRPPDTFIDYGPALGRERAERLATAEGILPTGVPFLDDAMGGLTRNSLMLVGAYTGTGKTQLVAHIAHNVAGSGKHVHFFALEAEPMEIQRRMKYRVVREMAHAAGIRGLNYVDWAQGRFDDKLTKVEVDATEYLGRCYGTLHTYYRRFTDFTPQWFRKQVEAIKDKTDLIIVDHLHYFDLDPHAPEHAAMKDCVKAIRDCSLITGKPVILVAHLRKKDRGSSAALPELDDFHGTSDISKIATHAVVMAPGKVEEADQKAGLWPTYMRVAKLRLDSARTRYLGIMRFNSATQHYEDGYSLARWWERIETPEPLEFRDDLPGWARHAQARSRIQAPPTYAERRRTNDD